MIHSGHTLFGWFNGDAYINKMYKLEEDQHVNICFCYVFIES